MPRTVRPETTQKRRGHAARQRLPGAATPQADKRPNACGSPGPIEFEQFLELTTDGVWRYDVVPSVSTKLPVREQAEAILARARLGLCNPAFARLYGFERPEDLTGLPLSSWLVGTDEEKTRFVADCISTGYRFVDLEVATQDREGRVVWTASNVAGVVKRGRLVGGWGTSHDITDRKTTETVLEDAHADLHATLEAFPDLIFEIDGDGRVYDYHAPDPTLLYADPESFLGETIVGILPPDAASVVGVALQGAVANGAYRDVRYALNMPGGRRWFDLSIARKGQKRGTDARYIAIVRDVTAQEGAAAALRASEERLALALTAASDGVYDVNLGTGETYYSPGYYTMLGYAPSEFPPSDAAWKSLLHPDDKTRALDMLARCVSGDVDEAETEFRLRTKTGGWRHIVSRGRVVERDKDGRARRLVGTHRDVTAQWEANEAMRQERDRAQAYLDIAEVMLVALDREGVVTLINRRGCRLLEYESPSDVVGQDWFATFVPEADAGRTREVLRKMMASEAEAAEYHENPIVTRSGRHREIAWHNALLYDSSGRIAGTLSSGEDITERRQAERALERTVTLLSQSEEISHVGSWELDAVADRLMWSDELYRIFGLEPQEFPPTDRAFHAILHPEDRESVMVAYAAALREGKGGYESFHRLVRQRTGEVRYVLERCAFVRDAAGSLLRVFGMVQDMTERQRTEAAMKETEEKYRLLVENAAEAVFVAQDGFLKFANPATAAILGRPLDDVASRPFPEFIHSDDRAFVMDRYTRRLAGEVSQAGYAFRVLHADGKVRWVQISAVRIDWEGRPATLNFVTDITERRAAEDAQRESEERFRRIFEESPIGMVTVGADFRFTRANSAFCRMLGYSEEEILAKSFVDITHPDHVSGDVDSVRRLARGEIPLYRTEKRYLRKDGRVVWGALTTSAMRDAEGRLQYFLSMIEDITASKEAEAALAESERKYRELASDLPTCVFEANLDGRLTYANRTGLEWFGYAQEEALGGLGVADMVVAAERERARRTLGRAVEDGEVPAGEYTALRKDGTTFRALVSSRAIVRDGRTIGIRGIVIDITERVEAARRVERALAGTIHALTVTTEMRDPYTGGHQERVARLAVAIGKRMELPESRLEALRVAGLLHDVGKVSIPAEILSKPTGLNAIEFELVKSHPETGHAILREIEFPWPVAVIVLQHHERMDGSGYPKGLRGDEILLEARILAVADIVEAMTSHRPYRAAFGNDEALVEIRRGRGTVYDDDVAAACLSVFEEEGFRFDE